MTADRPGDSRTPTLQVAIERWPIRGGFTISRGAKHFAEVVVATLQAGDHVGRGECVPYAHYGESLDSVVAAIEAAGARLTGRLDRRRLQETMPAGAARNALDCALWDLEAKQSGRSAAELAGFSRLAPEPTAFTISLADPDAMAEIAAEASAHPILKLKLGGEGDVERLAAIRAAVPNARLIADANEAWHPEHLETLLAAAADAKVELIEQPLPAGDDYLLAEVDHPVPICADESVHDREGLGALATRYDAINIKLDKTGGLTEALELKQAAHALDLRIMVGCMVATSLAMAPALLVAQGADWVDLDGPLLLGEDRTPGLRYADGLVFPPEPGLWG